MKRAKLKPGTTLKQILQAAYNLSSPQGMGFLHFDAGPLSDDDAKEIIDQHYFTPPNQDGETTMHFDYVNGRAIKLLVIQDAEERYLIDSDQWFDHSVAELHTLLAELA